MSARENMNVSTARDEPRTTLTRATTPNKTRHSQIRRTTSTAISYRRVRKTSQELRQFTTKTTAPSGPTPAQGKAEASGSHERDEQQGEGWEEDRWKNKRYYYAVEVTDKEDKEPNPWARAGHMIEEEADRTTEDVGSLAQPTLAGIADSKVTAAVAQADETKGSQVKTILEPDGHDQQEPRIDPARDGERKEEEGRPRDAGHSVARTEEMESRSNKKGFMAVAPPPHQPAAARHKPADRSKRTRSTSITTVTNLTHRSPKQDSRRPTTDRHPHRRIGEASNPGPPRQVTPQHTGKAQSITTSHVAPGATAGGRQVQAAHFRQTTHHTRRAGCEDHNLTLQNKVYDPHYCTSFAPRVHGIAAQGAQVYCNVHRLKN